MPKTNTPATNARSSQRAAVRRIIRRAGNAAEHGFQLESLETRRLCAADPITVNHPIWTIAFGTPRVDGVINASEWAAATPIVRAQANQYNSTITLRLMYNERGLFISADVKDDKVWADGNGGGTGNRWDFAEDDGLGLYFDPMNARRRTMGVGGRFIGINLGQPSGPQSGPGIVTRWDYLKGNGKGWGTNVNPDGALTAGMKWRTRILGTVNNNSDTDTGWQMEMFLPWAAINVHSLPTNGSFIGMNFQWFSDNTGGTRDNITNDYNPDPNIRFGPRINDDEVQGVFSSFDYSWSGFRGPINYAQAVFADPYATDQPRTITDLSATTVTGYGAHLDFTSPAVGQTGLGTADHYEIRFSPAPITNQGEWDAATPLVNTFSPKDTGLHESLRIGALTPATTYYAAIRAVDSLGREGDIAAVSFTTQTTLEDTSGGQRIMLSPDGGGLITEAGDPFVMVGSHAPPMMRYVRNLYPGLIWSGGTAKDFMTKPGREGDADGYFDMLKDYGVNTLRVPMEWLPVDTAGTSQFPSGNYWMESSPGVFNPDQRDFLHNLMDEAARVGIRLIIDPFNTYKYADCFDMTAWSVKNGGPLTSIDNFFQTPAVLTMAVNRMKTIIDWIHESPNASAVLGIEPINEWDTPAWTMNAKGNGVSGRVPEMRDRAVFMVNLAHQVHAYDPDVLLIHTGDEVEPRGPIARAVFTSDAFDILAPHLYTRTTSEGINNPDTDKFIRPAIDYGGLAAFWMTQRRDDRPIHNGEWGNTSANWPGGMPYYTGYAGANPAKTWTVDMDAGIYRSTAWTTLASGWAGPGLRLGDAEFRSLIPSDIAPGTTGYIPVGLPTPMRNIQLSLSHFVTDTGIAFDWAHYNASNLAGHVTTQSAMGKKMLAFGSTDGEQGLVYVVKDSRKSKGAVSDGSVTIDGLDAAKTYSFEVWTTGANATVLSHVDGVTVVGGKAVFNLPQFSRDVVIKFKAA